MSLQRWSETIWVLSPRPEPGVSDDLLTLSTMLRSTEASASAPAVDVLIDFAEVDHINSSNLSQLLRLRRQQSDASRRLVLTGVNKTVWSVFVMTGLEKLFEFMADKPTALASLQVGT